MVKGIIGYSESDPGSGKNVRETVWDTAYLQTNEDVCFYYVPNSAVLHNGGLADGTILAAEALFSMGQELRIGKIMKMIGGEYRQGMSMQGMLHIE